MRKRRKECLDRKPYEEHRERERVGINKFRENPVKN